MSQPSSGVPRAGRIATLFDLFWGELARRIRTRAQWRRRGLLGKPTKQQQRRRAMRLEALEPRLLLSADLTYSAGAGVLDATLRLSDDGSTLELIDNQTLNELASATPGAGEALDIWIDGGTGNDQLIIDFSAFPVASLNLNLGEGADTVEFRNFAPGTGATVHVDGQAGHDTIRIAEDGMVSTRALASGDHLTGLSSGDSANVDFFAETIDLRSGAKLLTQASAGFLAGDILLEATDVPPSAFGIFIDAVAARSEIVLDGATLLGGNVTLTSAANADRSWDELGPGFDVTVELLDSLNEFGGVAKSDADADLSLLGSTRIEASSLTLSAIARAEAEVRATGMLLAVAYGEANPHAEVLVGAGVVIATTGDLTISTLADSTVNVEAKQSILGPNRSPGDIDVTIAVGVATIESTAWIQQGALLTVGGNLAVSAQQLKSHDVTSSAGAYEDGAVGTALALSGAGSAVNALLDGNAAVTGSVIVAADTLVTKNVAGASAQVGSGIAGGLVLKAKDKAHLANLSGSFFQQIMPQPDERSQTPTKFAFSAAFAYADHENLSLARIGAGAQVSAESGPVSVSSTIIDAPKINARAFIDSQKISETNPAGNTKENSAATSVVWGSYANHSQAYIGEGAIVDGASGVAVLSETSIPLVIDWGRVSLQNDFGGWAADISQHANSNFGLANGLFTSWAQSNAGGTKSALAFSVDILNFDHASHAYIAEGAQINQNAALRTNLQDVRVEATSLIEAVHLAGVVGLKFFGPSSDGTGVGGSYLNVDYRSAVTGQIHRDVQLYADALLVRADAKTHNFSIAEAGGKANDFAVNGAFSLVREHNFALARIDDGAHVTTGDNALSIPRVVRDPFTRDTSGVEDLASLFVDFDDPVIEDNLLAIEGNIVATDAGADVDSIADDVFITDLNQLVAAEDESSIISIAGGLTKGQSVGAGFSISINEISRDTQALVGNRASAFDGASVDGAQDTIEFDRPHGYVTGEEVVYDPGEAAGIAAAGVYYAIVVDPRTIRLAQTRADAFAESPIAVDLQDGIAGETHRLGGIDEAAGSLDAGGRAKLAAINHGSISAWSVAGAVVTSGTASSEPQGEDAPKQSGKYGFGLSLNVSVNSVNDVADARVEGAAVSAAHLEILARDVSSIVAVAGAVSVSTTQDGIGGAGAWTQNTIRTATTASVDDASVTVTDGLALEAENAGRIFGLSASLSGAGKAGVAGSVSVNQVDADAIAGVADSTLSVLPGDGEVSITATNGSIIHAIAGAPTFGGKAGIGASVAVNTLRGLTEAALIDSDVATPGAVSLFAETASEIAVVSAAIGASRGSLAAAVAVSVNTISDRTQALVSGKRATGLQAGGDIAIEARDASSIVSLAGSIAGTSGTAGVGIATAVNVVNNSVDAIIAGDARIESTGGSVRVSATQLPALPTSQAAVDALEFLGLPTSATISSGAIGGGGANNTGAFGSVSVNVVSNETRARIGERAADYVAGEDPFVIAHGKVAVESLDDVVISAAAGNVGGGGTAGIGISSTTVVTNNQVEAFIGASAEVRASAMDGPSSGIFVTAMSTEAIRAAAVGGTFGGTAGVAGSATVTVVNEKTQAFIDRGARVGPGAGAAGQNVLVLASDDTSLFTLAGALAGGGTAGIGAGADVLVVKKQTEAHIAASAAVDATHNVVVKAESDEDITSISAALGGGGTTGIGGAASVPVLDIETRAFIGPDRHGYVPTLSDSTITFVSQLLLPDTIQRTQGSWLDDGFRPGQSIRVSGTQANDGIYEIAAISADGRSLTLAPGAGLDFGIESIAAADIEIAEESATPAAMLTEGSVSFVDDGTLVRTQGSWIADGFSVGQLIRISGSDLNDGMYRIAGLSEDGRILTLSGATLATEQQAVADVQVALAPTVVTAQGNVSVAAENHTEIDLIGGNIAGAGTVSVGAAAAVPVVNKETQAFIGRGAIVHADASRDTMDVKSGGFDIAYEDAPFSVADVPAPLFFVEGTLGADINFDGEDDLDDASFTQQRTSAAQLASMKGVAVSAINRDDIEAVAISGGGAGAVAVNVGGAVNVVSTDTAAFIDAGALVDSDESVLVAAGNDFYHMGMALVPSGAGTVAVTPSADVTVVNNRTRAYVEDGAQVLAAQDIAVTANALEDILSVSAGVAAAGVVGVGGAVSVISVNSETRAHIGDDAAAPGEAAVARAGGDVLVSASDHTDVDVVAGGAGVGIGAAGVGASVAVTVIHKDTQAFIGDYAQVDAGGAGTGLAGILDGALVDDGASTVDEFHGLAVQAQTSENVFSAVAAVGGGFYAGVAGAVTVEVVNSDTAAFIGEQAAVNLGGGSEADGQSVNVSAYNDARVFSFAGGLGGGFVGVGGAVDVGVLRNNTSAYVGAGAEVQARDSVAVNALSEKDVESVAVSLGAGVVGGAGSVTVWAVGAQFGSSYSDGEQSEDALAPAAEEDGNSEAPQYADVESFADAMAGGTVAGNGYTALLDGHARSVFDPAVAVDDTQDSIDLGPDHGFDTGAAVVYRAGNGESIGGLVDGATYYVIATDDAQRVQLAASQGAALDGVALNLDGSAATGDQHVLASLTGDSAGGASSEVEASAPSGAVSAATASTEVPSGTVAFIAENAIVDAEGDISIRAHEELAFGAFAGGVSAGVGGIGGSVAVANLRSYTDAHIAGGAIVEADGAILVSAAFTGNAAGSAFAGQLGLITLGAQVVVINDTSEQIAYVGDGATLSDAASLTVSATGTRVVDAKATGGGIAGAALGWAHASADLGGGTFAYIGDATVTGVDQLAITSDSDARAFAEARAVAGGIVLGASGVRAAATVDPTVRALVASGASIDAAGDVAVAAHSTGDADAHAGGITIGGLGSSIGSSEATALLHPDVAAYIADAVVIAGAGIALQATHNVAADRSPATNTDDKVLGARARANASGGSTIAGNGAVAEAQASPEVKTFIDQRAQISAGADLSLLAAANNEADARASGLTISLAAGLGTSVATAEANGTTAAFIGPNPFATDPGLPNPLAFSAFNLLIEASASNSARAAATAPGGGLVGILGATANATVSPTIQAFIGDGVGIDVGADVSLLAHSEGDAEATAGNFTIGAIVSVGSASTEAIVTPDIDTYIGAGAAVDAGGSIALQARHNYGADGAVIADRDATADSTASGGGIVGVSPASAQATANADVLTAVHAGAVLIAGQAISLASRSHNESDATADGSTGGVVAVGDMTATATATGTTESQLSAAELEAGTDVSVFAKGTNRADALAESANGGVVAVRVTQAEADAAPTVRATLSAGDAAAGGNAHVDALALGDASAESNGVGGGLVDVASADAIAKWRPTVEAAVLAGTTLSADGDVGVRAYNNHNEAGVLQSVKLVQADAKASGGGVVSAGPSADAETIVDSDVLARIGAGAAVSAGNDLDVIAKSRNNAQAQASGVNGGVISAGFPSAVTTVTNHARALAEDAGELAPTQLTAGQDIRFRSHSDTVASATAFGGSGGLGAFASTTAAVHVFDEQAGVRIGDFTALSASQAILLEALKSAQAHSSADGRVLIAVAASNFSTADTDVQLLAQVEVGEQATLDAASVQVHAKVTKLDADGFAFSRTNAANTTSAASSLVDVASRANVVIEAGARIDAADLIEIVARQDGVDVDSDADAKIVGFTGTVRAKGHNDLDLDSDVDIRSGAALSADAVFIEAESPKQAQAYGQTAAADAATVVQWVVNTFTVVEKVTSKIPIIGWIVKWITKTVTTITRVVLNSSEDAELTGGFRSDNSINLSGDIFQGASSSPTLVVDEHGNIDASGGIAAGIVDGEIVVSDIAGGEGAGVITLRSPGGALSGNGTIHKNSSFAAVTIINHSDHGLRVNDIRSINPNPLQADIQIESDPELDSSDFAVVSDLGTAGESPQVTIRNHGDSQLRLAGAIENPTGVTKVVNAGGDILGEPGAFLEGREIMLQALAGDIGAAGSPLHVRLYADDSAATLQAQAAGDVTLETRLLEIGESTTPVPTGHVIAGATLDVAAHGDVDVHALQSQVLVPAEDPEGAPLLIDVGGRYWLPQVASAGGSIDVVSASGDLGIGLVHAPLGSVRLSAAGAIFDADDDAASDVNALDIALDAGSGIGSSGNALEIDSNGTVTASASHDIHLSEVAGELRLAQAASAAGSVRLVAAGAIVGDPAHDVSGVALHLTAGAGIALDIDSAGGLVDATAVHGIHLRELEGDLLVGRVFSNGGDVQLESAGSLLDGDNSAANDVEGMNVDLAAVGGSIALEIDSAGLVTVSALQDVTLAETAGDLVLGLVSSSLGAVQLTAAGAIRDNELVSIQAASATLNAGAGIGASDNALDTSLGALQADAGTGGLWLVNAGALDVGDITAEGEVIIVALSPIVVSGDIVSESVYLEATDTEGPGDDLTVLGGASITATAGSLVLVAGDNLVVEAGSIVSAQGGISFSAGGNLELAGEIDAALLEITGNDDDNFIKITQVTTVTNVHALGGNDTVQVGGGSVDEIHELLVIDGGEGYDVLKVDETADYGMNTGTVTADSVTGLGMNGSVAYADFEHFHILLGAGHDMLTVASTHAASTSVDGGAGDDILHVGEGNLSAVGGPLSIVGGAGNDTLNVEDTADNAANSGTLTGEMLTGLGLPHGIAYEVEQLNISLGSGADAFHVRGTSAVTNVRLNDGDDRIYVSADGELDDVQGALNIDAGAGRHRLVISDAAATQGDADMVVTDVQPNDPDLSGSAEIWITGLAPAAMSIEASRDAGNFYDGIEIFTGSGADQMRIDGTHQREGDRTMTTVHTGAGDDQVTLALDEGEDDALVLYLGEGDDTVDASASTLPLVMLGGAGNDHLTSGSGDDLIFGDNAAVDIANGADTNPRWRALLGNTLYDAAGSVQVGAEQAVPGGAPYWEGFGIRLLDDAGGDDVVNGGAGHDQIFGQAGDDLLSGDEGEDYIEGNAGADTIYGGMGQDDLVGGSSSLFSLDAPEDRPDGADLIFGGDGADVIVGDNGNIYRIAGAQFAHDAAYDERIVVRVAELLDSAIGDADEIHGDLGDDVIYGQRGDDRLFGDAGDDDLIGGQGNDWILGGAGQDGILGDGGRIFTSRNGTVEPLYGIVASTPQSLSTPGNTLQADIDVDGELKKSVYLAPPGADSDGDDVLFGGLDGDWLHGGGGNDALSGEEGNDALFGNGGDDQLVGGSDSDHLYGGSGNDVLDAGGDNAADIAFGGVGEDTLIADIAGDRLIDWVGASNTFITPSNGMPTVMRMPAPWMLDFLQALARSDGADVAAAELGLVQPQQSGSGTNASIQWEDDGSAWGNVLSPFAGPSRMAPTVADYLISVPPGKSKRPG